jgi:hypothetical protein
LDGILGSSRLEGPLYLNDLDLGPTMDPQVCVHTSRLAHMILFSTMCSGLFVQLLHTGNAINVLKSLITCLMHWLLLWMSSPL